MNPTTGPADRSAFARWRDQGGGWSPLFSEPMLESALAHLEPALRPGSTVLELGSGPGHMAAIFHGMGARALALDVDLAALRDGAGRHPGPPRLAADQARLPIATASVDALFSFSTFQYSDHLAVLAECRRVLRPGGRIAVVENLAGNPFASAGRWLRAATRTRYPAHLQPRRHLRWSERSIYERCFRDVRCEPFHLLTAAMLMSSSMAGEPVARPGDRGGRALYSTLRRWDRSLVRRWPAASWCIVVCGVR